MPGPIQVNRCIPHNKPSWSPPGSHSYWRQAHRSSPLPPPAWSLQHHSASFVPAEAHRIRETSKRSTSPHHFHPPWKNLWALLGDEKGELRDGASRATSLHVPAADAIKNVRDHGRGRASKESGGRKWPGGLRCSPLCARGKWEAAEEE
jgi:hypothetical protein